MSSNNLFNSKRFGLLFKQNLLQNSKMMLYSVVAFCGVVFMMLSLIQLGNDTDPFNGFEVFLQLMTGFVAVSGVLYTGYSFPGFRTKESTINYLTLPASTLEKLAFEFINRIVLVLVVLPILFWPTFNLQGLAFEFFSGTPFNVIGLSDFSFQEIAPENATIWLQLLIASSVLLLFILPFTGAALFSKQPLVKTVFSVVLIITFYIGFSYIVVEPMGLSKYNINDSMILFPSDEYSALRFFALFVVLANLVMLTVAYLKLKEKEV